MLNTAPAYLFHADAKQARCQLPSPLSAMVVVRPVCLVRSILVLCGWLSLVASRPLAAALLPHDHFDLSCPCPALGSEFNLYNTRVADGQHCASRAATVRWSITGVFGVQVLGFKSRACTHIRHNVPCTQTTRLTCSLASHIHSAVLCSIRIKLSLPAAHEILQYIYFLRMIG